MATINLNGSNLGNNLQTLLMCDSLTPGDEPSYQVCKTIYLYHPLGAKMAEAPIKLAQSQSREINISVGPETELREAFTTQWARDRADDLILNLYSQARVYGIATLAVLTQGVPPDRPLDFKQLPDANMAFNILDPLNTAGTLVLNQDPNSIDFQKKVQIGVQGVAYHRSRTVTVMNENPIYIAYTHSAFGFVGRSVYQRALFPLKTFIQSMVTDDMVLKKAGVLVAMIKMVGSVANALMVNFTGQKRSLLKEAQGDNVISIGSEDKIESINLQNLEGPTEQARKHVLENIAMAGDMPAKVLNQETFAEGFGEGTEDAKAIARWVERFRISMKDGYDFMDEIIKRRAWTPEFYKMIQSKYPTEYGGKGFNQAFYEFSNAFKTSWPSLLTEPDSEKLKGEELKFKTILSAAELLLPKMDPENAVTVFEWIVDNLNENTLLVSNPLSLDSDLLRDFLISAQEMQQDLQNAASQSDETDEPNEPRNITDSNDARGRLIRLGSKLRKLNEK